MKVTHFWLELEDERVTTRLMEEDVLVARMRERGSPGEVWDHDPGESVNQAEHGDPDEGEPPKPENQEVLLVEQVVGEDAQVVRPVDRSSGGADSDVASHLGGLDTSEEVDD